MQSNLSIMFDQLNDDISRKQIFAAISAMTLTDATTLEQLFKLALSLSKFVPDHVIERNLAKVQSLAKHDPLMENLLNCLKAELSISREQSQCFKKHIILAICAHLASKISHLHSIDLNSLASWQINKAKSIMLANIDQNVCIQEVAKACDISLGHFSRGFAKDVGEPPHRWIMGQRVNKAKELMLKHHSMPLSEIALKCGFADQSHLTRVFAKRVGITPANWRKVKVGELY